MNGKLSIKEIQEADVGLMKQLGLASYSLLRGFGELSFLRERDREDESEMRDK